MKSIHLQAANPMCPAITNAISFDVKPTSSPSHKARVAPNIAPPTKATRATPPFEVDTCAVSPFNVASIVGYPTKGASSFATTSSDAPISTQPSKAVKGPATGSTPTITHLSQHLGRLSRHCWLAGQRSTAGPGHSAFP